MPRTYLKGAQSPDPDPVTPDSPASQICTALQLLEEHAPTPSIMLIQKHIILDLVHTTMCGPHQKYIPYASVLCVSVCVRARARVCGITMF